MIFLDCILIQENSIKNASMQFCAWVDILRTPSCPFPMLNLVFQWAWMWLLGKKKYYSHFHVVHQLCHEMKHDNQNASMICPIRIEMLVKVSHNHGMNMRTWWQCSYLEGDDGMSISCGALWKHHKRPFIVNSSLLDIACCMVFWFHRDLVHMWII